MKKKSMKLVSVLLTLVMFFATFLGDFVPADVYAAENKVMAHIKAGTGNGNGHFGSAAPEAFVLSDKADITNEAFSFQVRMSSEQDSTRFRFVTKYVDDNNWGYIGYDGNAGGKWFYEYKVDGNNSWPDVTGTLPAIHPNDMIKISGTYETDGIHLTVENLTTKESGTGVAGNEAFNALASKKGKIGFGAGYFKRATDEMTDIYFSDVVVGAKAYTEKEYANWTLYREGLQGQIWEPEVTVNLDAVAPTPEVTPTATPEVTTTPEVTPETPQDGKLWYKLTGGSNNGGGHAYGNASARAPIVAVDQDKKMEKGGTLSLSLKPSNNWGVFHTYVDDNNWLYVGWDSSSKWYFQYKFNGNEKYPKITGLPDPVEGEKMDMQISLSQETLSVTVNGTTARVQDQELIKFVEQTAGKGKFGVKTNGATTLSFTDVKYNNQDCMKDNWTVLVDRAGQKLEKVYTKTSVVTGTVTDNDTKAPIEKATVRVGSYQGQTAADGTYTISGVELGEYGVAVSKPGYEAYEQKFTVEEKASNTLDVVLSKKADIDLSNYDVIETDVMKVYVGKEFPLVARYQMKENGADVEGLIFKGNETKLDKVQINGTDIKPTVTAEAAAADSKVYNLHIEDAETKINMDMKVQISASGNTLTWEVLDIVKGEGCPKIATIDVPGLNLLTVDASEEGAEFAGAVASTVTRVSGDSFITFENGFIPSASDSYIYGFLSNGKLSAGVFSNSEAEKDQRVVRNNGADTMSLTSAPWYFEMGDKGGIKVAANYPDYPVSELPYAKVAIAADENKDGSIDWNDGAIAYRQIMHYAYGSDVMKDLVNYRIIMNFASMAPNPYLATADNVKKVYLATDGLPQALLLKGYGNEGHDSANSEYADIAEREGGVEDFRKLIQIAHDYDAQVGVHINAQEAYPESASFNEDMIVGPTSYGWGWLDQSNVIDKIWDLSTQARWKRLVQFYDRINGTSHYNRPWPEVVGKSEGSVDISKEAIQAEAESLPNNMDFIYLDVWYQDSWETRQIAKEFNSLGWRFSTEFSSQGEYDSTWQHWATDAPYGGADSKGYNSDIIRFLRNDQRDSQVLNHPVYGGTADNPLLGGMELYGFEGWVGQRDFNNYITQTFNTNLPTKFLQHYQVMDWENYPEGESPVGNHEKQIVLENEVGDKVVVTRNEAQRADNNIERTITLNDKVVLNDVTYLLPWTEKDGTEKLYHWNLDGGTTTWQLPNGWDGLGTVVLYELSDQGRINKQDLAVSAGSVTIEAKPATAYVVVKGEAVKTLKHDFGEMNYVVDPGFNGYPGAGENLDAAEWSGDISNSAVVVEKAPTGDQRLAFNSPAQDVAVTTEISGLKAGTNYVAEIYVESHSDAKAFIEVNPGSKVVSNYAQRSVVGNYVRCDNKSGSMMQRMQVYFTAEGPTAQLTLKREAGEGSTYMDDIRIVEKTLNNVDADGNFVQDFESVVQGLYPFVLSSAQGIDDPATHLSQLHAPYTQTGWGGKLLDDVLEGNWSLKHHSVNTGIIYQTIPQSFRFEPGKVYKVEFDYQTPVDKAFAMVIGEGTSYTSPVAEQYLSAAPGSAGTQHAEIQVVGSGSGQTWIGLYQNGSAPDYAAMDGETKKSHKGEVDFVLDNLKISEVKDAVAVTIDKKDLYKGETALISGSGLDQIKWENTDDTVAVFDPVTNKVSALKAGTTTLKAILPDGSVTEFVINVTDQIVTDVPEEEVGEPTASANTEEAPNEAAGLATDKRADTHWHSQWNKKFEVTETNPAVLTIEYPNLVAMDGFKMQQRASGNNGIVKKFSYKAFDENGNEICADGPIVVPAGQQANGAWITQQFPNTANVKKIEISVLEGENNFAAIAEVEPIRVQKVADKITLKDAEVKAGETLLLDPVHAEGTLVKGLVWTSSDDAIATVSQQGLVTGVKEGEVTITVTNAAGLKAQCKVVVKGVALNKAELEAEVAASEKVDLNEYKDGAEKDTYVKALADAKDVLKNAATQEELDKALTDLRAAKNALVKKETTPTVTPEVTPTVTPEVTPTTTPTVKPDVEDKEAPTVPAGLKASNVKENSLEVRWDASKDNVGVEGYMVYVDGVSIGTVKETGVVLEKLKPGKEYKVEVKAFDKAGNISAAGTLTVKTKGKPEPTVVPTQKPGQIVQPTSRPVVNPVQPSIRPIPTGDSSPIMILVIVMILAAAAIVGVVIYRKRK